MEENENKNILEPIGNSDNAALMPIGNLIYVIPSRSRDFSLRACSLKFRSRRGRSLGADLFAC